MASLGELLQGDQFSKLKDLRDDLPTQEGANASSEAAAKSADYGNLFSKQMAQDAVDAQSIPGHTAEQSAETLAPKELPATLGERGLQTVEDAVPNATSKAGKVIELGSDAYKTLPGAAENTLPTVVEGGAGETAMSGLSGLLSKGIPLAGALSMLFSSTPTSTLADEMPGMRKGTPPPATPAPTDKDSTKAPISTQENRAPSASDEETPTEAREPSAPGQSLKDMLNSVFGSDLNDNALQEAQQHRNQLEKQALMGRAGKEIAAGISRGAYNPNYLSLIHI